MYYKVQDFIKDWELESESTLKIFINLTDESLNQKVTKEGRSIGRLAWHLIATMSEMGALVNLGVNNVEDKYEKGTPAKTIVDTYQSTALSLKNAVMNSWKDEDMMDQVNMYGQTWTKGMTLEAIIKHQIHHRGQISVLMRQAGLKVPGVYGPANEEWASMGMDAPE